MKIRRLFFLGSILLLSLALPLPSYAQQTGLSCERSRPFYETGLTVCDPFLTFFDQRGGLEIFGNPMSAALVEDGRWVQYFQRVRMEYHPGRVPGRQVELGPLGELLAPEERKARISPSEKPKSNDPARQYFPATGHTVQFSFLRFFTEHGGAAVFGKPVTEFFPERGRVVQYFEYAKMEWQPHRGGSNIVLHNLGEQWIDTHETLRRQVEGLAPGSEGRSSSPTVTALHATVAVRDAVTGREGQQTVWVYVTDQLNRPVEGAAVSLFRLFFLGATKDDIGPTDPFGHAETTFTLTNLTPGQSVVLAVQVHLGELTTQARTFFTAWW